MQDDFATARAALLALGWDYPSTAPEKAIFWKEAYGFDLGPRQVVHSDKSFPGIIMDGQNWYTIQMNFLENVSERYGVLECTLKTTEALDVKSFAKMLSPDVITIYEDAQRIAVDFGLSSMTAFFETTRTTGGLTINTTANSPREILQ
ncbi:hypothetical protein [uncultured Tateyamaria sp.]|uniref:hypothetical protein n=1 Tax=uncultured Tateyamaria sp. TaxID=455651 RepID=UPI00261C0301|nr:hypothetical protein [uncultured Tateyamaria sp.]